MINMNRTEEIKDLLNEKYVALDDALKRGRNSSKKSWKLFYGTTALSIGSIAIFSSLKDVLNGSDLVLACIPSAVGVFAAGFLTYRNTHKTNDIYAEVHNLDVEIFDLKLEGEKLMNKKKDSKKSHN